jgi:hypothetical protein
MAYTVVGLKDKILEMYPKLGEHGVVPSLIFDPEKNAYILKLKKGPHELTTHLEKMDADACMGGRECVHLGVQVGQFLKNFEEGE